MFTTRQRRIFPEPIIGYELRSYRVAIVQALAATNLVLNPSLERDSTGYNAAGGAAIARSTDWQAHGVYSLKVTPGAGLNDGAYYTPVALAVRQLYTFSLEGKFPGGIQYQLYFANSLGQRQSPLTTFYGTGKAQRVSVGWQALAAGNYRLYVTKVNSASVAPFYVDGWQCEAGAASTYIDGDQRGFLRGQNPPAYNWNGAEHASTSSRAAATRAGGVEVDLARYGFRVLAVLGLGLSGFANLFTPNAFAGGAQFERTVIQEHTFSIVGALTARGQGGLQLARQGIEALVKPNAAIKQQPLLLKIQEFDDCGDNPIGDVVEIPCTFEDGLAGQMDNDFQERVNLTFKIYLPYMGRASGDSGAALGYQTSFTAAYAARRINGQWLPLGSGFDGAIFAVKVDRAHGRVYYGGYFTTANGVTVNHITYWDIALQQFVAMGAPAGTGASGVRCIEIASNGDVWIGGNFTTVNGVTADGLARWNFATSTWTPFTNGTPGDIIYALAIDSAGNLYGAGSFVNWDAIANADYIWKYNGVSFSALSVPPFAAGHFPDNSQSLAVDASDNLWTGETNVSGVPATVSLRKWNPIASSWTTVFTSNSAIDTSVAALYFDVDGRLYLGGNYTSLGGVALNNISVYNGSAVSGLGSGVNALVTGIVRAGGLLIMTGKFTTAGGLALSDQAAGWNGSAWVPLDVDLPTIVFFLGSESLGEDLYFVSSNTGTAIAAVLTPITNTGSGDAYLISTLTGPGTVVQLKNYTTGDVLYFNLTLNAGEIATLDLMPGQIRFYSNFRPNLLPTILPGSSLATFRLTPGANSVSVFVAGSVNVNTAVTARWRPTLLSIDDALYR